MPAMDWSDFSDNVVENYGEMITEVVTQSGPGNEVVPNRSTFGCLQEQGRVVIGGADSNDRYARDWGVHNGTGSAESYGVNDNYSAATQESFDSAQLPWKRVGIALSHDDMVRIASTRSQIRGGNPVSRDLKHKLKALIHKIETDLLTDGTGNSSKDITGFKAPLSESNTYAGISQSANSWWQADVEAVGGALSKTVIEEAFERLDTRDALKGGTQIWMPRNQWNNWRNLFVDSIERVPDSSTSEGFRMVFNDGADEAEIKLIRGMTSTEIWIINPSDFELRFMDQSVSDELSSLDETETRMYQGVPIGFKPIHENRDVTGVWIRAYCQLVCTNPYHQAVLTGVTA